MNSLVDKNTPIAMLTVGQLVEILQNNLPQTISEERKYVYGMEGLAKLFGCSAQTASRIKSSGKIDAAIKQIGRKIIVDAELALELVGKKNGGRR